MKPLGITVDSPTECTIVKRLNRFVVEIQVSGEPRRAWINNTGRLKEYLFDGNRGFCTKNKHPLKTAYRLFAIKDGNWGAIIDTQLQMKAFEKTLVMGLFPWME